MPGNPSEYLVEQCSLHTSKWNCRVKREWGNTGIGQRNESNILSRLGLHWERGGMAATDCKTETVFAGPWKMSTRFGRRGKKKQRELYYIHQTYNFLEVMCFGK